MKLSINVNLLESAGAAALGGLLSSYLPGESDSATDTAVHALAAVGLYVTCKSLYQLTNSAKKVVSGNDSYDAPEQAYQNSGKPNPYRK